MKNLKSYLLLTVLFLTPSFVFSAGLVPDCGTEYPCNFCDLMQLINNIVHFIIYDLTVPITILIFSYIGFLYITDGGTGANIKKAKPIFMSVLTGLFLMLSAWLIVDTITAVLLKKEVKNVLLSGVTCERTAYPVYSPTAEIPGGLSGSPFEKAMTLQIYNDLKQNDIGVSATGNCYKQFASNCTYIEGLQPATIDGVVDLAQGCRSGTSDCKVTITGAAEVGHSDAHTQGKKVDLSMSDPAFNKFMESLIKTAPTKSLTDVGMKYSNIQYGGKTYTVIKEGDHWDILVQ